MLWGLCLLYFALSFAMKAVTDRLPLLCSMFWPLIAVWGITWTIIGYGIAVPYLPAIETFWGHVGRLALIFIFALPGQVMAYSNQMRRMMAIFRQFDINKQTTGITIYLHEMDWYKKLFGVSRYESVSQQISIFYRQSDNAGYYYFNDETAGKRFKRTRSRYYH